MFLAFCRSQGWLVRRVARVLATLLLLASPTGAQSPPGSAERTSRQSSRVAVIDRGIRLFAADNGTSANCPGADGSADADQEGSSFHNECLRVLSQAWEDCWAASV